jgi:hypothetical protein
VQHLEWNGGVGGRIAQDGADAHFGNIGVNGIEPQLDRLAQNLSGAEQARRGRLGQRDRVGPRERAVQVALHGRDAHQPRETRQCHQAAYRMQAPRELQCERKPVGVAGDFRHARHRLCGLSHGQWNLIRPFLPELPVSFVLEHVNPLRIGNVRVIAQ